MHEEYDQWEGMLLLFSMSEHTTREKSYRLRNNVKQDLFPWGEKSASF